MLSTIRKIFCKFNIHYHPGKDGIYISGISHSTCYACGEFIEKTDRGWKKASLCN